MDTNYIGHLAEVTTIWLYIFKGMYQKLLAKGMEGVVSSKVIYKTHYGGGASVSFYTVEEGIPLE